jgi:pyruvate formate lyase activating enzyme
MVRDRDLILGSEVSPEEVVNAAQRTGCRSIAYTYTEPTIFFEYAYDTARLAHDVGIANIFVTNGYMTEEMLQAFDPYLDAANVDLKGFNDEVYRKYIGAQLQPVLDAMKKMKELGIWLEVTTLIIPGINDDPSELREVARFVVTELGAETPWHVSRFFPAYKMTDMVPTPISTLQRAEKIGREEGLRYIYSGNVPSEEVTLCHECGHLLVRRSFYDIIENNVRSDGRCSECGTPLGGVGMAG